ncbi:protein amnionless-like isoform X1 [Acropora millepora]|uniref:protein amnionless-like isoform X1 n=1 Tax=Acropora millepora TaxID=45264 RepID=UPI001CF33263|nr:protein amnionless-like isoform X1 [Acropora millepora]
MEGLPKPVLLVLYLLLGNECTAVTKRWLPNTNFNNSANWDKGRVPCVGDNVQLNQEGRPLAVSLRTVHTLKSLSLPVEGEVIFFDGAELHFSERQEPSKVCKDSGDIHFVASVKDWHNPSNWKDDTLTASFSNVVLHMDNVPCVHDTVLFPKDSTFWVQSSIPIKVASLELYGQGQSDMSFKDFYTSKYGSFQFNLTGLTNITSEQCHDETGCACGNLKFSDTICSHVKCKKATCSDSFKPEGSCCDICGTLLKIKTGKDFHLDQYRSLLMNISHEEIDGVRLATSKTEGGFIQIVLTDEGNGQKAQKGAQYLKEVITSEKAFRVAGTEVLSQSTVISKTNTAKQTGEKKRSRFIIPLAVGLSVFLVLVLVALFVFYRRKKAGSFTFDHVALDDNLRLEMYQMDKGDQNQTDSKFSAHSAWDNPLYESTQGWK